MNKKTLLSVAVLMATMAVLVLVGTSFAYRSDYSKRGPNYNPERHEAIEKALENNDYEAWKKLMGDRRRVSQIINKENFAKFAEAHKLAKQGKYDEARAIRAELGLGQKGSCFQGQGHRMGWRHYNNTAN